MPMDKIGVEKVNTGVSLLKEIRGILTKLANELP